MTKFLNFNNNGRDAVTMKTDEILQFFTISQDSVSFEEDVCELAVSNSLSPSGVGDTATGCLARKVVERSLQKASDAKPDTGSAAFLGTQCHTVLQHLMELPPKERTKQAVTRLIGELSKSGELVLPDGVKQRREFSQRVADISNGLFAIEDPKKVKVIATEFNFETTIWDIPVRGSIDRIDELADGTLRIVDYKTGKYYKPDPRYQDNYGPQLVIYALAAEQKFGRKVTIAVDYFVGAKETHEVSITEEAKSEIHALAQSAWKRLGEVRESQTAYFVPSGLCPWCPLVKICPAANEYAKNRANDKVLSVGSIKIVSKKENRVLKYEETEDQEELVFRHNVSELINWTYVCLVKSNGHPTPRAMEKLVARTKQLIADIGCEYIGFEVTPVTETWGRVFGELKRYESLNPIDLDGIGAWCKQAFEDFEKNVTFLSRECVI